MPKIVDNYVLERKIGEGQFGYVYKGYNNRTNEDCAIKMIKRQLIKGKFNELLENEIKVLYQCDNVNILKLITIKKTANNYYLITEYCNEGDFSNLIKEKGHFCEEEATEYLMQLLHAFKTLVENKIMHRDIKPSNLLRHEGQVKVADFGFSKLLGDKNYASTMLGSPLYMAPEGKHSLPCLTCRSAQRPGVQRQGRDLVAGDCVLRDAFREAAVQREQHDRADQEDSDDGTGYPDAHQ